MQPIVSPGSRQTGLLDRTPDEAEDWQALFSHGQRLQVRSGQVIFREGEPGGILYQVESGHVDIVKDFGGVNATRLVRHGPGDVLGEMTLLRPAPRFATAVAATDCVVRLVDQGTFRTGVYRDPELALALARVLTDRVHQADDRRLAHLERQNKELAALQAVAQAMARSLRLDTVLNALYEETSRLLDVTSFTVALYDDLGDSWRFPMAIEAGQPVRLPDRPVGRDPLAYVLRRREPLLLVGHVRAELLRAHIDVPAEGLPPTWLGAPIQAGERVLGVLSIGSDEPDAYDAGMVKLISAIAAEAASAIENARQYEHADAELAQRVAELAARNQELKALHILRDDLTDMIVHDLRNPLNVVMTGIDLSLEMLPTDHETESGRDALAVAADASRHMLNMVNTLLDISRIEAGQMPLVRQPTDLREMAQTILRRVRRLTEELRISIETSWPDDLPLVSVDAEKIERVLVNLLDNAIKFTPPNGSILLSIQIVPSPVPGLEISVVDSGPGIPAEQRRRIFDKFAQLRTPGQRVRGSGIGLAFCKLAVEAHGGSIWVISPAPETGNRRGAAFHFMLPIT